MMTFDEEIMSLIGQPEGAGIEYKSILPPSRNIAQTLSAFANSEGGCLILGVTEGSRGEIIINGLSKDYHATSITHKAIDLLSPKPTVDYSYIIYQGKSLFVIRVQPSTVLVSAEGKIYKRVEGKNTPVNPVTTAFNTAGYERLKRINQTHEQSKQNSTGSKVKLIEHYQSVLKLVDDLKEILYPISTSSPTNIAEGKILMRILFASCVDNFEIYLADLLYEIFLANPSTLKTDSTVTVTEVLNCSDMQEFINYFAKKKLSKLQRGSIKGFLKENTQINDLNVISDAEKEKLEGILQIRHLYAHRNGIVDEKFLRFHSGRFILNQEHLLSLDEMLDALEYFSTVVSRLDLAAINQHRLAVL